MSSRGLSSSPAPKGSHDTLAVCSGEDSDSWSHQIKKKYAALSRSVTLPELVRKCKSNPPLPPRKVSKRNNETCEVCGDEGRFVCCDACPRVFHFLCLNPPLSETVIASQSIWYCPVCRERPSTTKTSSHCTDTRFNIFAPLIDKLEHRCPKAFVPPKHIVDEFEGVAANSLGEYVNTLENRPLRSGQTTRLSLDPTKTTERCFHCQRYGDTQWLITCDYCPLAWHMDCLDPPLTSAPPANKKWMCPNHAAHAMPVSRRWKRTRVVKVDQGMPFATGGQIRVIDDDEDAEIAIYRRLKKARLAMRHDTSLAPQDDSGNRNIEYMVNSSSIKRAFCLRTRSRRVVSSDTDFAYSASLSRLFDDRLTSAPYRPSKLTTTEEWLVNMAQFQQQVADLISARVTTALPTTDRIGLLLKAALNPTPAQPAMEDHVPHSAVNAPLSLAPTPEASVLFSSLTNPLPTLPCDSGPPSPQLCSVSKSTEVTDPISPLPTPQSINSSPPLMLRSTQRVHLLPRRKNRRSASVPPLGDDTGPQCKRLTTDVASGVPNHHEPSTAQRAHLEQRLCLARNEPSGGSHGCSTCQPQFSMTTDKDPKPSLCCTQMRSLLAVQELMRVKGEKAMLDFLLSPDS